MRYFFLLVLPVFTLAVAGLFYPFTRNEIFGVLGFLLLHYGLGISTGFHRVYAHSYCQPRRWLNVLLLSMGTGAGQGSSVSWVAAHRENLRTRNRSFWKRLTEKPALSKKTERILAFDLKDPLHLFLHRHYYKTFWILSMLWLATFNFDWVTWAHTYLLAVAASVVLGAVINPCRHDFSAQRVGLSFLFLPLLHVGSYRDNPSESFSVLSKRTVVVNGKAYSWRCADRNEQRHL